MKTPVIIGALALSIALAPAAMAQKNERVAVVYGEDVCPPENPEEIVVCARKPESERFRLPDRFRKQEIGPAAGNESWAVRAAGLDKAGPHTGVNDCSVVGPGGWTGCYSEWLRSMQDERRATRRTQDSIGSAAARVAAGQTDDEEDNQP